ncbi:MAG TPA: BamA/TamA family outer membrane protein [Bacteroidota bacterium]|nr:BamA/TamA family outer membrane protein [Bacteroidota bacterium]
MMMRIRLLLSLCVLLLANVHAQAQFYYFGQNKVQYTTFEWHVLKTEHFDVYYYPEMKDLAEQGAYFAEESYRLLEGKFNHTVREKIPLIFYSTHLHFQQTNTSPGFIPEGVGGFFEFMKGRVVIPADGSLGRFRHVIRHELVHVFMTSKVARVLADHRVTSDRMPPLWFTEGLAEYWSTVPDDQAEMVMRDAVLNNYIVPLTDMEQIYGTFVMYKEGQNVLGFIADRYGEDKILLMMENVWRSTSFSDVMKFAVGKSYKEIDEEWIYTLKKKYYPLLSTSDFAGQTSTVILKNGFNTKPFYFRRNGKGEIYFIGNYMGYTSVYRVDAPTNGESPNDLEPHVVVEGERSNEFEAFHLFQSRLSINRNGILAFVTKSGENDVIHLFDVNSESRVRTLQFDSLIVMASPSWSPDGTKLVFSSISKSGRMDLYQVDDDGDNLKRLTDDVYDDRDPVWSPDGSSIIFSSDRNELGLEQTYDLYRYDCAQGTVSAITSGKYNFYSPSFSPDGKFITFTSNLDGAQNIWAVRTAEIGASSMLPAIRKVTRFSNAVFDPCWSDSNTIIFAGFENYSFRLQMIDSAVQRIDSSDVVYRFTPPSVAGAFIPHTVDGDTSVVSLPYRGEYSLDIAQSEVSTDPVFGTAGGAVVAVSDLLGNDQYYFLVYNNAEVSSEFLESFNIAVSRISLGSRTNYATGIFHFSGRRYDLMDPDEYYYERSFGGYLALSYPISRFNRIDGSISMSNSDKEVYVFLKPRKAVIGSLSMSYVHDNSLWGPTGPLDGSRFLATAAYTKDVENGNVNYYTLIGDYRHYFRLGLRTALATRIELMMNEGAEARRFILGGSWDLRGYPRWSLRGKRLWLSSLELRFPFVDQLGIRFPFGGIGLGSFRGALFVDAGNTWDNEYKETLGSVGAGLRWNLGGVFVLRYDVGKRIVNNFSRFDPGLFYQFFFGWDF